MKLFRPRGATSPINVLLEDVKRLDADLNTETRVKESAQEKLLEIDRYRVRSLLRPSKTNQNMMIRAAEVNEEIWAILYSEFPDWKPFPIGSQDG